MDRRGAGGDNVLVNYVIYIVLGLAFFLLMFFWIVAYQDGAGMWEDFYAKEIARVLNDAVPGEIVLLDVSEGSAIGFSKGLSGEEMFRFDNDANRVTVRFSDNGGSSFPYFNDVEIEEYRLELVSGSEDSNRLYFRVSGRTE